MNSRDSFCTPARLSTATRVARENRSWANSSRSGAIAPTALTWVPRRNAAAERKGFAARVTSVITSAPSQAASTYGQSSTSIRNSSRALATNAARDSGLGLNTFSSSIGRTASTAPTWASACFPLPTTAKLRASREAIQSVASPEMPPVRRLPSAKASITATREPLPASQSSSKGQVPPSVCAQVFVPTSSPSLPPIACRLDLPYCSSVLVMLTAAPPASSRRALSSAPIASRRSSSSTTSCSVSQIGMAQIVLLAGNGFLPQLPRPLERGAVRRGRAAAFLLAQELDRPLEQRRLQLHAGIHLGVDRAVHRLGDALADHRHAVAAHQHAAAAPQRPGERLAERPIAHQQIVVLAHLPDVEHRRARPQERGDVTDRAQLAARSCKRDHRGRMAVHHGHHLRPRAVDLAVNVALDESLALVARQRLAVGVELHQVGSGHQCRRARARHEEMLRPAVAARADMAVGIEHLVRGENAARCDQVLDEGATRGRLFQVWRLAADAAPLMLVSYPGA